MVSLLLWDRIIDSAGGAMTLDSAKAILAMTIPPADRDRYAALSERAQRGELTPDERADLEAYVETADLLGLLQSKARTRLSRHNSAA